MKKAVLSSLVSLLVFLSFCAPAFADVFSIWPFGSRSTGSDKPSAETAEVTMSSLLGSKKFWNEPISVNGKSLTMHIALSDHSLAQIRSSIKETFPDAQLAGNIDSLLVRRVLKNGNTSRIYLLQLKGLHSLLQFSMELPKDMPEECPASLWPSIFPKIGGASDFQLMTFSKRSSDFATFTVKNSEIPPVLEQLVIRLKADGWVASSAEHSEIFEGTGEVFVKEDPARLLLVGVVRDAQGHAQVSFYHRNIK